MSTTMKQYGFSDRFEALAAMYPDLVPGRILSQEKGLYRIAAQSAVEGR